MENATHVLDEVRRHVNAYWGENHPRIFMGLAALMRPWMSRGAVNSDGFGEHHLIHTELVHLALVYNDIKMTALIADAHLLRLASDLGMSAIALGNASGWRGHSIIYKPAVAQEAAQFASYVEQYGTRDNPCIHFIMGHYLSYPFEDVMYFCRRHGLDLAPPVTPSGMPSLGWSHCSATQ